MKSGDEVRAMTPEDRLTAAALLVSQALGEVDAIHEAKPVGYADFGTNFRRAHNDRHPFTMRDAKPRARVAARLMREAWQLLDPST
jgi:hypothetical protein